MSWSCSLALVEEFSRLNCLDTESCAQLRLTRTAGRSSFAARKKATWNPFPSGMTFDLLTAECGVGRWMLLLEGSRVSPSRPLREAGS